MCRSLGPRHAALRLPRGASALATCTSRPRPAQNPPTGPRSTDHGRARGKKRKGKKYEAALVYYSVSGSKAFVSANFESVKFPTRYEGSNIRRPVQLQVIGGSQLGSILDTKAQSTSLHGLIQWTVLITKDLSRILQRSLLIISELHYMLFFSISLKDFELLVHGAGESNNNFWLRAYLIASSYYELPYYPFFLRPNLSVSKVICC